jgi:hypothetical protein
MPTKDRETQRRCSRNHYRRNKEQYLKRNRARADYVRGEIVKLKEASPCADCGGFFHYSAMDYHHRDRTKKAFEIAHAAVMRTMNVILAEIAKCDLLCANCHRIRTWKESVEGRKQQLLMRANDPQRVLEFPDFPAQASLELAS